MNNEKLKIRKYKQSCTNVGVGLASTLTNVGIDPVSTPVYKC